MLRLVLSSVPFVLFSSSLALAVDDPTDCREAMPAARARLAADADDLGALKAIARCTLTSESEYANAAKQMFEESQVLSVVPQLLEMAQLKDLIPVLRGVETKKSKSVGDYLMLGELYEKMGQPDKEIAALQSALAADPGDPRPTLRLAAHRLHEGNYTEARSLYRKYLANPRAESGYMKVYVTALAYPWTVLGLLTLYVLATGILALRLSTKRSVVVDTITQSMSGSRARQYTFFGLSAVIPIVLAVQFAITGQALCLGLLLLKAAVGTAMFALTPVMRLLQRPWSLVRRVVGRIFGAFFGVGFARILGRVSPAWRVLIALATMATMGTIVPAIAWADLRYTVMIAGAALLFGTIGSLVVTFLRTSVSLRNSLRWVGVVATLPFLLMFLMSRWNDIGAPLMRGGLPLPNAMSELTNYLIMWGVCVVMALHLSRIIADALATPVRDMMWKVTEIERGDFAARVKVESTDEIGSLAQAVNRMAQGLARRDYIERTFSRYVDKKVVEKILSGHEGEVHIRGQRMHAIVMFTDIRGFTTMSEGMTPEATIDLLNEFFERMVGVIRGHGGIIDKFIGDNIMAVWGVPTPTENGERQAVAAAIQMMETVATFNKELAASGRREIGVGIGINAGTLVAGSLGSKDRMEYTVVGDVVNTAQRAEAGAKAGQILVTDAVREPVATLIETVGFEDRRMKGKAEAVRLWDVKGWTEAASKAA